MTPEVERPPFPDYIDNSSRSAFTKCPTSWYYGYLRFLASPKTNVHLHAGGAFAKGMEVTRKCFYDEGLDPTTSVARGCEALFKFYGDYEPDNDSAKTATSMAGALIDYFIQYPLESRLITPLPGPTGHTIEFGFNVPLPINHPTTGQPLLYVGRFDMLGELDKALFVVDEKTASQLGPTWSANWELDAQFTGYCWGAREYGYPVAGAVIRGVSILKNGFGHAQAIVYRPDWVINRWYKELLWDIQRMIDYWNWNQYPMALDKGACNAYGGCGFKSLCNSPNPEAWAAQDFVRRQWNPLTRETT